MGTRNTWILGALLITAALCRATGAEQVIDQYQQVIDDLETHHGAYDIGLAEPLQGLGEALHANGDHLRAIAVFKRSLHVRRVNNGITSFSQEPILRLLNTSYKAIGNDSAIAINYQRQLDLYQEQYGTRSLKLIPLHLEAAQWHQQQYAKLRNVEAVGHLHKSVSLIRSANEITLLDDPDLTEQLLTNEIKNHYFLIRHYRQYTPELPREYIRTHERRFRSQYPFETNADYQFAHARFVRQEVDRLTADHKQALISGAIDKALLAYEKLDDLHSGDPLAIANTLAQHGDWLVLFDDNPQQVQTLYRKSWQLLTDNNLLAERTKLFGKPQMLPVFDTLKPINSDQVAKVKMDIDANGKARNIAILETQPANKSVARKAQRQLRDARFRSRLENGEPTVSKDFELSLLLE